MVSSVAVSAIFRAWARACEDSRAGIIPLAAGQALEGRQRFVIGDRHVVGATGAGQVGVLRAYCRVIETGRDGIGLLDLSFVVLHQIGIGAVQYAFFTMA